MKKLLLIAMLLAPMASAFAQNSAIYKADEKINEGKLDEAAAIIEASLTSGKTKNLAGAYNIAGTVYGKILQGEIAKAAGHQPLDTAKFVSALDKSMTYFQKSFELDNTPDEKGKIKAKYGAKAEAPFQSNYKMITQMMSYYAYAGQFLFSNGDKKGAYQYFEKYINMPKSKVFTKKQTDSIYEKNAHEYRQIAYFTCMLGYEMKDYDAALKHIDYAMQDTAQVMLHDLYFIKSQSLLQKKDTAKWVTCVTEAISKLPSESQYVQNLLYYYNIKHLDDEAVKTAESLIAAAPQNKNAWYSAGCIYLNTKKNFDKARECFTKAIELDPKFADPQYNMGVSYINEVISKKDQFVTDPRNPKYKTDVEKVRDYYRKALTYFEKTRELVPEQPKVWALSLKNVYYNLEMKDKEKEIDEVLKTSGIVVPDSEDYGKTVTVKKKVPATTKKK